MRSFFIVNALLLMCLFSSAQQNAFPESFVGNWKGTITWNRPTKASQQFTMRLNIQPADSGRYTWQIIYGDDQKDNRPYILMPVDTATGHWQIDERNTIVLDGHFIGNSFTSVFSVSGSTIVSKYELTAEGIQVSFTTFATKPKTSTGGTSKEIPPVDSYKVVGLQQGLLKREK
ncbi:hypothetical protein [Lacibacter sediminis]|uniref:Lipocalin family protein n=1 Tax=Lacibacter sediminis TaxID=2760713 RepID=A0A7G5XEJ1_9BACT|nr:hypothetical protein [Lacibacter sediminis]QNA43894.1 hypothetical protein H4075_17730 [Lacibacter sediminis]